MISDLELSSSYSPALLPRDDPYARLRPDNAPVYEEPLHFCVAVQSFSKGGYEAVVKCINAQRVADNIVRPRGGRRVDRPLEERSENDILRAQIRAKKQVRLRCKEMCADRFITLTTRQFKNTPEELLGAFRRFVRMVTAASGGRFDYLAVPEAHPTNPGHFHLHVAVSVWLNVHILRRCWYAALGARPDGLTPGQIDIKRIVALTLQARVWKVASYISKYIAKETIVRFNKKRYWSSRVDLPAVKRYWLKARNLSEAFAEAAQRLGFEVTLDAVRSGNIFSVDTANLCWFQCMPGKSQAPPF